MTLFFCGACDVIVTTWRYAHTINPNQNPNMNAHEINLALRALRSLESEMARAWHQAQKSRPNGAMASSIGDELREVRKLADKLFDMYRAAE